MTSLRAVLVVLPLIATAACTHGRPNASRGYQHVDHLTAGDLLEPAAIAEVGAVLRDVYPHGLAITKTSEGWRPFLYDDVADFCTIGYGHLVKKQPCDGTEPDDFRAGLSEPQGASLLVSDMTNARSTVSASVVPKLSDGQYAALCDFVFNVGSANFRSSTLLRLVNAGQNDEVPAQFRRWVVAGGKPRPGLRKRREREIDLYFDGLPKPPPFEAAEPLPPIDIRAGEKRN